MATPNAPNRTTLADPPAPAPRMASHPAGQPDAGAAENTPAAPRRVALWQNVSFYIIICALAGVGLMIAVAGAYVFEDTAASIPLLAAGAILVIIASSAGLVAGVFIIVATSRELFKGGQKTA